MTFHPQVPSELDDVIFDANSFTAAGQTVTIPFEFVSATGDVLGSENLTLQLPAAGQTETFRLDFQSAVPVAGFRYAKVEGL